MLLWGIATLALVFLLVDPLTNLLGGGDNVIHLIGCVGFGMAIRALLDQIKLEDDVRKLQAQVAKLSAAAGYEPRT